jgi:hypothetical protein
VVVHRKKLWKARLKMMRIRFTFEELEETYDGIIPKSNT